MLTIDHRGLHIAAAEIATAHTRAELDRILPHCPAEIVEAVRAHVARNGYRSRPPREFTFKPRVT